MSSLQEFHNKSSAQAQRLAKHLGVELKMPDLAEIEAKAKHRIMLMEKYHEQKDMYDTAIHKLLDIVPADVLQSIISKLLNSSK